MKLTKFSTLLCVVLSLGMTLAACAPTPTTEGTGGYIDDTIITTNVKAALLNQKNIKSTQISVQTFKGRVQLSGFVSSDAEAVLAVETARKVRGVVTVINSLHIR